MAIILKEGKLHKHMAWITTCDTCGSELKILQGDPLATNPVCFNCDASQYYVRYVCPVCGSLKKAYTNSSFGIKGNAMYKDIILEEEDRKEIESWENQEKLKADEEAWVSCRARV